MTFEHWYGHHMASILSKYVSSFLFSFYIIQPIFTVYILVCLYYTTTPYISACAVPKCIVRNSFFVTLLQMYLKQVKVIVPQLLTKNRYFGTSSVISNLQLTRFLIRCPCNVEPKFDNGRRDKASTNCSKRDTCAITLNI